MRQRVSLLPLVSLLILAGCGVHWKAAEIYSADPNRARQQHLEDETNKNNVEAFIAEHPELDEETKKELRDGTLTPAGAKDRLKKIPPKQ